MADGATRGALVIRDDQLDAMGVGRRQGFEERLVAHVRQYFPALEAGRGEAGVRALVRAGVERCAGWQIRAELDVARFIDVMVVLGDDFDRCGDHPWARKILLSGGPAPARVGELVARAARMLLDGGR